MVVAANELQDFADGLSEFGVGDAAADVEADENFCSMRAQFARQIEAVRLAAVASHGSPFPTAGNRTDQFFRYQCQGRLSLLSFKAFIMLSK